MSWSWWEASSTWKPDVVVRREQQRAGPLVEVRAQQRGKLSGEDSHVLTLASLVTEMGKDEHIGMPPPLMFLMGDRAVCGGGGGAMEGRNMGEPEVETDAGF